MALASRAAVHQVLMYIIVHKALSILANKEPLTTAVRALLGSLLLSFQLLVFVKRGVISCLLIELMT